MDCKFSITIIENYVCGNVEQELISNRCIYKLLNAASSLAMAQQLKRFLFDLQGVRNPDETETTNPLDFLQLDHIGFYRQSRIAIVLDAPIDSWTLQVEKHLQNTRFDFKLFTNKETAVHWLIVPIMPSEI
jgi:hypothetical protein